MGSNIKLILLFILFPTILFAQFSKNIEIIKKNDSISNYQFKEKLIILSGEVWENETKLIIEKMNLDMCLITSKNYKQFKKCMQK